jgi:mRNA interferase MazF
MYTPGSVIYIDLGKPPLEIKGHEQGYKRPCIVLKDYTHLKLITIISLTTKKPKNAMYSIVAIPSATTILKEDSFALCHQIRTVSYDRVKSFEGTISNEELMKVKGVLYTLLF